MVALARCWERIDLTPEPFLAQGLESVGLVHQVLADGRWDTVGSVLQALSKGRHPNDLKQRDLFEGGQLIAPFHLSTKEFKFASLKFNSRIQTLPESHAENLVSSKLLLKRIKPVEREDYRASPNSKVSYKTTVLLMLVTKPRPNAGYVLRGECF